MMCGLLCTVGVVSGATESFAEAQEFYHKNNLRFAYTFCEDLVGAVCKEAGEGQRDAVVAIVNRIQNSSYGFCHPEVFNKEDVSEEQLNLARRDLLTSFYQNVKSFCKDKTYEVMSSEKCPEGFDGASFHIARALLFKRNLLPKLSNYTPLINAFMTFSRHSDGATERDKALKGSIFLFYAMVRWSGNNDNAVPTPESLQTYYQERIVEAWKPGGLCINDAAAIILTPSGSAVPSACTIM